MCLFKLTFFGEFSLTSFAYFDILNLRLTERNYSVKSSQGKKKESQKKKGKDNEKKTYLRRCAHHVRDNVPLLRCKSKKNGDDTTAPSESGAAVDAVTDESTEPSSEETTEPEKKEPAADAIKKVTDSTKKPGKVNTTTPSVKKPEWKKAGKYTCGKNLAAGEYYVVPNSKKCSLMLTDGKDGELEFDILPCGLFVTMKAGYTLEVKNGKFILASEVNKMGATNGKYKLGSYRVGVDIPAGITTLGSSEGSFFTVFSSSDYFDEDATAIMFAEDYPVYYNLEKGQRVLFMEDTSLGVKIPGANSDGSYNSGMYKVGKDIKPGKYTLVPTDSENGYMVYYDLRYIELSIKDYKENVKAGTVITLTDGTYFRSSGLKLVPYVEPGTTAAPETTTEAPETTTKAPETTTKTPDTTTTTAQGTPSES